MEEPRKLSNLTAAILVLFALLFDVGQMLFTLFGMVPVVGIIGLVVSIVLTLCAGVAIGLTVILSGVPILRSRRPTRKLAALIAPFIIELIPFLAAIPAITPGVIAFILIQKSEEAGAGYAQLETSVARLQNQRNAQRQAITTARQQRLGSPGATFESKEEIREEQRLRRKEEREGRKTTMDGLRSLYDNQPRRNRQASPDALTETEMREAGLSGFRSELERNEQF